MFRRASATAVLLALTVAALFLHASALANGEPDEPLRTDPDTFSRSFKTALNEFISDGLSIIKEDDSAKFKSEYLKRFSQINANLTRLDKELRQQNAPRDKRIKALRERYLEWAELFNHFGPIYDSGVEYDVKYHHYGSGSTISISRHTGGGSSEGGRGIGRSLEKTLLVKESWERERLKSLIYPLIAIAAFAASTMALFLFFKAARRKRRKSA